MGARCGGNERRGRLDSFEQFGAEGGKLGRGLETEENGLVVGLPDLDLSARNCDDRGCGGLELGFHDFDELLG